MTALFAPYVCLGTGDVLITRYCLLEGLIAIEAETQECFEPILEQK